ncbi:hypothetical protein LEP1GSC137_3677 [Leptospira borgpetersenii str. Noumea 25]|uniref:Uncharacterized protein n=1 Tax=Leptospira borgpetersenii serovar Ballum TaxID=280505 RepID=A0A0S2IST2_LEPBO|nr:hypothetical protein LBBP_02477 [Leptospira borgpetersenii serovar Ballum]EKR01459.1 hypothetical protein LEP1GSC121_2932 [Leptospira borgpetersenii serovar Castellonis str. 200801910]EMO10882.1 hypothetical protein LEP1GSC137_3677 [Leptospira borgpetersenii str. Noumea 25]
MWDLMYIQDKPERKHYFLIQASLRSKKLIKAIARTYLAIFWKLKEFAPLALL